MSLADDVASILREAQDASRFSAAACLVSVAGRIAIEMYVGEHAAWDDNLRSIPTDERSPTTADSLFDLASVTKTLSAHTALSIVADGMTDLDAPVGDVLPTYRSGQRAGVTLRHLLGHRSGLPAEWMGWRSPLLSHLENHPETGRLTTSPLIGRREELVADLLSTPLQAEPGGMFLYSCAGYNTAMVYLERLTGLDWPTLVRKYTIDELGLSAVTFRPDRELVVSTEYEPEYRRGVIRGDVHDEASWSLGGEVANAGLFSTARDLLTFGDFILRREFLADTDRVWDGLGLRVGDPDWGAYSPTARTHIGFTGTLLHLDRETQSTIVLLTNRVHPSRERDIVDLRHEVVSAVLARGSALCKS